MRSRSDYLCEDRTRTPFFNPFFHRPLFRRERTGGEHAKKKRETMVYRLYQRIHHFLSLAFCVDSKKYYNLCLAGREKYNSLFRRVYKEDDNRVPRMGESRPPSREEKGLKMRGGSYPSQTRTIELETGKKLYFILSYFSHECQASKIAGKSHFVTFRITYKVTFLIINISENILKM